jgi:hypothetical protein
MKNQYLAMAIFMAFSMVACGNSIEETAIDELVVLENTTDVMEEIAESKEEVIAEPADEVKEAVNPTVTVVEQIKSVKGNPKVSNEVEVPQVKEEIQLEVVRPNHISWDGLTKKYVTSSGKVNYKGMKADLPKINTYLAHLKNTPPKKDWSKNEKLAYWINLYNASTVYLVATNYPTSSITKLSGGKPWDKKFVKSGTKIYSLNDIENTIVRPQFKEPRIHAALNCAAVSCPKLLNGAFLPSKLNAQLDKQTRAWINDAAKNKLKGSKAQVSQIFDWYKVDFKNGVPAFINKYISTGVALETNAKITYLEYDWALNE